MKSRIRIAASAAVFATALASAAADTTIGLNFCDAWPAPHIASAASDGFDGWTDSRHEWDWTNPAVQTQPLPLGDSGVTATWNASNTWSAGEEQDNDQALYRVYLDDGQTAPGTGVRVTISGLGAWLAANGHTAYQIRCYSNNDSGTTFQPVSIRYGPAANGPVLHTMTPAALGDGGYPTSANPPGGQARGYADSPATLTSDTITLALPPRNGTIRGTLCAFRITASDTTATPNALTRDRWNDLGGWRIADLTGNRQRFLGLPDEILTTQADPAAPGINEANLGDFYATRHRGFLTAPATGWYRFWITSDDEAELWLADGTVKQAVDPGQPVSPTNPLVPYTNRFGKQLLANIRDERAGTTWADPGDFDRFPSQRSRAVHLTQGKYYYLEILHKDADGPDHLALAWQPPGQPRTLVPASALTSDAPQDNDFDRDGLPDAWETRYGLNPADNGLISATDGQLGDLDGDGVDNLAEFQLGTRPDSADTDGDGIDDRSERDLYHTDPLVSNRLDFGPVTAIPVQQYNNTSMRWIRDASGTLTAIDRRGEISYPFTVSADPAATGELQPGILEVTLSASAAGIPRASEKLALVFSIDGNRFAAATIISANGNPAAATVLTPWLTAGPHTLTILHDNYRAELAIRVHSLALRNIGGEDLNENGRPDWLDQRLASDNRLTRIPATSLTSPVCIEGLTSFLPGLTLTAGNAAVPVSESIDSGFYADVPLDETGAVVDLTVNYQSGALTETHAVTWAVTDLSTLDTIDVRQGDSLRLDASQAGNGHGQTFGTYSVALGGTVIKTADGSPNHHPGQPFRVTFDTPGAHPLAVAYHGNKPPRTVTVNVHSASFGPALSARAHFARDWQPPAVGQDAIVQPDSRIAWLETSASGAAARSFRVNSTAPGQRHVLARLPEDVTGAAGAILSCGTVNTFYLAYLDETSDIAVVFTYPDGTKLMRGSIVAVGLPPDIAIRLNTYYQGTVFLNGANQLWLTAADFDQNGIGDIYFEWAGQGNPYVCTYVDLFTTEPPPAAP
jgi:hypothetical protein